MISRAINGVKNPSKTYNYLKTKKIPKLYHDVFTGSEMPIWDDWDLAIILDACRPDVLVECSDDFSFIPSQVPTRRSNAAWSLGWMHHNFTNEFEGEMSETVYVTGNPYTSRNSVNLSNFLSVEEVWKTHWSDDLGTLPPEPLTDRAIEIGRREHPSRLIVHYMQPHFPSIPEDIGSQIDIQKFGEESTGAFERLEQGKISLDEAWEAYRANCRHVLGSVETLLSNYDTNNAVITADHANAFGEWGVYGHPEGVQIKSVRNVPWIRISAEDEGGHSPQTDKVSTVDSDVEDRLQQLGYR